MNDQERAWESIVPSVANLTLRDFFAAMAMHAMISGGSPPPQDARTWAGGAYRLADEMLAVRKAKATGGNDA
jgi:hypothetical protein